VVHKYISNGISLSGCTPQGNWEFWLAPNGSETAKIYGLKNMPAA